MKLRQRTVSVVGNLKEGFSIPFSLKRSPTTGKINVATDDATIHRICEFGQRIYGKLYPAHKAGFSADQYEKFSLRLYSENARGEITATGRILFDSSTCGLPLEKIVPHHIWKARLEGKRLIEVGEFVIEDHSCGHFKAYHREFYEIAKANDIDAMIIIVRRKNLKFYTDVIGAKVLVDNIQNKFGGKHDFACLEWSITGTKDKFLEEVGIKPKKAFDTELYTKSTWNNYARVHSSILTEPQRLLFREVCSYLMGDILDCGCGTAKLAPLLVDDEKVSSYTGVDVAEDMVFYARERLNYLNQTAFFIRHCAIEEVEGSFTSAVSLQSYYSWPNPVEVMSHIYDVLEPGSLFVLATPNQQINQEKLLYEAEKELSGHPDFELFKQYNLALEANPKARFVSMDTLVREVQSVGFNVLKCHQDHYGGGVNLLLAQKA